MDLGCGSGLATSILKSIGFRDFVGVDRSPHMAARYREEVGCPASVVNFWDALPGGDSAVAVYSLHLCPPSRAWELPWRLREAGVRTLAVISPLKRAVAGLRLAEVVRAISRSGPDGKSVYGWVFRTGA